MAAGAVVFLLAISVFLPQLLECGASTDNKLTRKLTTQDLGKTQCENSTVELIYTKADGEKDSLHYLFSTQGVPTVLVVRTDLDGEILVDCANFASNNLTMAESINVTKRHYAYALLFNRLFEYNDTNDDADLTKVPYNNTTWKVYEMKNFPWEPLSEHINVNESRVLFKFQDGPKSPMTFNGNGSMSISLQVVGEYAREDLLPHLEYNANMTHMEVVLDNITSTYVSARFAIEMTMISMDGVPNKMMLKSQTYIDDEHSPGVFEMIDWTARGIAQDWSGFLQFKPVCYTGPNRALNDATKAVYYTLVTPNMTEAEPNLAYAYFGKGMYANQYSMTMTNVSFGLSKDKFYPHTNYTIWSASLGFGTPPADEISPLIIIILSVGLGLPILLIAFGSLGICIRNRARGLSTPYQEISSSSPDIN